MAPSDMCLADDAVQIFLEHLVDPLLPAKSSVRDNPTPSQQQSVAKQVHSVVLLYNYYHRKQHPELPYLRFNEFCKLMVVLRPPILAYLQFMQKLNEAELIDVEKQLSLTEKTIMDACDVCDRLDASKNVPNIEGWPITKVSILLVDSNQEYCLLLFDSIARGVWSLVEKSLDSSSQSSEVMSGEKHTYKKKRIIRKPTKDEFKVDEAELLQVGYSAVKEATGISYTDIMLLESFTVYSQSKEKAASRFYIMQCSQSISQKVIRVPLKDVIRRLQGPLVKKSSSGWTITPVIDYFHVLPYAGIISQWISRKTFSNSLHGSSLIEKKIMEDSPEMLEHNVSKETFTGLDTKPSGDSLLSPKQKENNESCTITLSDSIKEPQEMGVKESTVFLSQNKEKSQSFANTIQVDEDQEKGKASLQCTSNGSASVVKAIKDDLTRMLISEGLSEKYTMDDNTSNSNVKKFRILLDSKVEFSQTALTTLIALIHKRNELVLKQRKIENEIAKCDKNIEIIRTGGEEDNLELKIEAIIEGCNDMWKQNQQTTSEQQSLPLKRKKLSEAVFTTQTPSQDDEEGGDKN